MFDMQTFLFLREIHLATCVWSQVLLRALRDFNAGKLTADDTSIFMGLLNDLFPKTLDLVPRADDHVFDDKVHIFCVTLASFAQLR